MGPRIQLLPELHGETLAVTGHRPPKLGGYGAETALRLRGLAVHCLGAMRPAKVITGMALGWDQAVCAAAITLHIPVIAAVPFEGQERAWPLQSQNYYHELIQKCARVEVICEGGYAAWKMQVRNEWMVDNSDRLLALWDGTEGGTRNCVKYAERKERSIINVWDRYVARGGLHVR